MELALLLVILAAWDSVKSGIRHSGQTRRKGSAAKVKAAEKAAAPGTLSPARKRAIKASHDAGWWGGEILGGFPVHRTGWHAGRLAHKAAADSQRAVREEARTTHLERRASVLSELPEHRKRQQEARDQIIAASADPETGKAKSRQAVKEAASNVVLISARQRPTAPLPSETVKPEPGPYAPKEGSPMSPVATADQNGNAAEAEPGAEAARNPSDPTDQTDPSSPTEGADVSTGTAETTYDQQITASGAVINESEAELARIRQRRLGQMVEHLQSLGLDSGSLGRAAEIDDSLKAQEKAAQQTLDSALAFRDGLVRDHGNVNEAHQAAPQGGAEKAFYQG